MVSYAYLVLSQSPACLHAGGWENTIGYVNTETNLHFFNVKTDQGYQFYLPWRPRHTQNPTSYVFLQCSKFAVKLSLKSKRESEKKRELGNRHLMYVLTLLNTINIQAHQRVQTVVNREAGKPW